MVSNVPPKSITPSETSFLVGDHVKWKHVEGYVTFVDPHYITICVSQTPNPPSSRRRVNECCVICYPSDWNDVELQDEK